LKPNDMMPWKDILCQLCLICWVHSIFQILGWNHGNFQFSHKFWEMLWCEGVSSFCLIRVDFAHLSNSSLSDLSSCGRSIYVTKSTHTTNQSLPFPSPPFSSFPFSSPSSRELIYQHTTEYRFFSFTAEI
jgi:hypothetical protein